MVSPTPRQPVWVTNLFENFNKPIRAKFSALVAHGLSPIDRDVLFDLYIQELAKGVRDAVRLSLLVTPL